LVYSADYLIELRELGRIIRFVDRAAELGFLERVSSEGYVFPIAVYGPEGCGKTTLLKRFVRTVSSDDNVVAVYVDALEEGDPRRAIAATRSELIDIALELASSAVPVGRELARRVMKIVRLAVEKLALRGKNLVVIVDDVYRAIGLDSVDRYTKMMYEWIDYLHRSLGVERVAIILTTSEGVSKRELFKHTYVHVYMMWNLPRDGFEDLVDQLEPPRDLDREQLWILTGGNPRALIELAKLGWSTETWLSYVETRVEHLVQDLDRERLWKLVEDCDSDPELARALEDRNLMIALNRAMVLGQVPNPSRELGIGSRWAWQIPAYRVALRRYLEGGS